MHVHNVFINCGAMSTELLDVDTTMSLLSSSFISVLKDEAPGAIRPIEDAAWSATRGGFNSRGKPTNVLTVTEKQNNAYRYEF